MSIAVYVTSVLSSYRPKLALRAQFVHRITVQLRYASLTIGELIAHLQNNPFFAGLDEIYLQTLAHDAIWREYSVGELIMLEGDTQAGLFCLQYGWVKVSKVSQGGREQVLRFIEPGETFNEIGVLASLPNPATAIALESAGIWFIRKTAVQRLLREHPDMAEHIIAKLATRLLYLVALVADLSLRPVTGRLASLLRAITSSH